MCGTVTLRGSGRADSASRNVSAAAADPKRRTTSSHDPSPSPAARPLARPPAAAAETRPTAPLDVYIRCARVCCAVHKSLLGVPAAFHSRPDPVAVGRAHAAAAVPSVWRPPIRGTRTHIYIYIRARARITFTHTTLCRPVRVRVPSERGDEKCPLLFYFFFSLP